MFQTVVRFLVQFTLLMVAVVIHEFAHGWVAYMRGDQTARYAGRLTLNPLAHIDPMMTVAFPLLLFLSTGGRFMFGAAKPVPVDFSSLKNPRVDSMLVGAAGPAANLALAVALSGLLRIVPRSPAGDTALVVLISINVFLAIFNLVPIPPLDGSRILMGFLPYRAAMIYGRLDRYGFIILFAFMWLGLINLLVVPMTDRILSVLL